MVHNSKTFALLLLLTVTAYCFNLAPKHAQIFKMPNEGKGDSYFGYTVALQTPSTDSSTSWLLVGAPRANSSTRPFIVEPGVMFQCNATSPSVGCKPVVLDITGNSRFQVPNYRNFFHDRKDNAWIGGSVDLRDSSGVIVVCGPRWSNQQVEDHYLMNGICYWYDGDTSSTLKPKRWTRLLPLINIGLQGKKHNNKTDVFFYAAGEAGISVHLTRKSRELLIGAPGVYDWTGTVIRYKEFDKQNPLIPDPNLNSELEPYDYFGYSLDSGIFYKYSRNKTFYVSGAPRGASLHGMVMVFDFPTTNEQPLKILITKSGTQFGEYFGASVCALDLNGDGLDDLLVGAPLHSLKQHSGDEGRVYVYINEGNGTLTEIGDANKMTGHSAQGGRFGTTIAKLGDLNMDGFNDVAVGAPYEMNGKGCIYIYHGRRAGINAKYSQRITASEFPQPVTGFGISISRGLDIDGNHYNDIAVGAHTSGHAILIRSQPVIRFVPRLTADVDNIGFSTRQFTVTACLQYRGTHATTFLDVNITLGVNSFEARAAFSNSSVQSITTFSYIVTLEHESENCTNITVQIKKGDREDYTKPIDLRMDYRIVYKELRSAQNNSSKVSDFCPTCPLVDPNDISYTTLAVYYATGCLSDTVCHTDLTVQATFQDIPIPFILGLDAKLLLNITVKNTGESAFLARVNVTFSSVTPLSRLPAACQEVTSSESVTSQQIQLDCDIANPLATYSETSFLLEVDTSRLTSKTDQLRYLFNASSLGRDNNPDNNFQELLLKLHSVADVSITGSTSHPLLIYSNASHTFTHTYEVWNNGPSPVNQVRLELQIPVAVANKRAAAPFLEVFQPTTDYVSSRERHPFTCTTSQGHSFTTDTERSNELSVSSTPSMQKKSVSGGDTNAGVLITDTDQLTLINKTLFANCSNADIQCMTVSCSVGPLLTAQTSVVVSITMRANLTNLVPLLNAKVIKINTFGKVNILDIPEVWQPMDDTTRSYTVATILLNHGDASQKQVTWWVLALAIAGGLLLLMLIAVFLQKVGFFKRSRPADLDVDSLKLRDPVSGSIVEDTSLNEEADVNNTDTTLD